MALINYRKTNLEVCPHRTVQLPIKGGEKEKCQRPVVAVSSLPVKKPHNNILLGLGLYRVSLEGTI